MSLVWVIRDLTTILSYHTSAAATNVQGIVVCQVNDSTYSIQCTYLSGRNASGCVYILVSEEERVGNITGTIEGFNSEGGVIGVGDILTYNRILAYDLEDGTVIGTLPLVVPISTISIPPCLDSTG